MEPFDYTHKGKNMNLRPNEKEAKMINETYEQMTGTRDKLFFKDYFFRVFSKANAYDGGNDEQLKQLKVENDQLKDQLSAANREINTLKEQPPATDPPAAPLIAINEISEGEHRMIIALCEHNQVSPKQYLVDGMLIPFMSQGKGRFKVDPQEKQIFDATFGG